MFCLKLLILQIRVLYQILGITGGTSFSTFCLKVVAKLNSMNTLLGYFEKFNATARSVKYTEFFSFQNFVMSTFKTTFGILSI